jgi:LysM repeat protein
LAKVKQKTKREASGPILVCVFVFFLFGGLFCSIVQSSENSSKLDNLAEIDSGFFVSKNDVYGLEDQAFKEKLLLFLTEEGILTKSSKGLIYYHISEEAIAKIEDAEFKEKVKTFVTKAEERKTSPQKVLRSVHEVQPGETLWNIAQRYGMSIDEIVRLNRLNPSETIYPGQKILVNPDWD